MLGNRSDKHYQLMMCALCATKVGQLSWNSTNKSSCFICGGIFNLKKEQKKIVIHLLKKNGGIAFVMYVVCCL
jgi:hypothetical protein